MFGSIFNFLATVPVANSALRAIIMLAEILVLGIALYWLWELVPQVPRLFGKVASNSGAAHPEKAPAGTPELEGPGGLDREVAPQMARRRAESVSMSGAVRPEKAPTAVLELERPVDLDTELVAQLARHVAKSVSMSGAVRPEKAPAGTPELEFRDLFTDLVP